jgi:Zn-dependent peptidase ImmA (M78 family)
MENAVEIKRGIVSSNTIPVDIISLALAQGLKISYFNPAQSKSNTLEDVAGLLDKSNKVVYINSTDSLERQRFTIAHELGHYIYNHDEDKYGLNYRDGNRNRNSAEKQADDFAAEVLMPSPIVHRKLKEYSDAHPTISEIASLFGVSKDAMRVKLDNMGLLSTVKI